MGDDGLHLEFQKTIGVTVEGATPFYANFCVPMAKNCFSEFISTVSFYLSLSRGNRF